jgi:hypothetical protein
VAPKAEDIADRSKKAGADAVAGVARTAGAIADSVAQDSPAIADYVRGAGQKIDRLATDLRDKKVGDLLTSAAEFGRSQPVILLAGAALVGFALSRLIKAGVATRRGRGCAPMLAPSRPSGLRRAMLNRPRRPASSPDGRCPDRRPAEVPPCPCRAGGKMSALRSLILILLGAIFLIAALGILLQAMVSVLMPVSPRGHPAGCRRCCMLGIVLFLMGQTRLQPAELSPDRTLNSLSRDSRIVKETLS